MKKNSLILATVLKPDIDNNSKTAFSDLLQMIMPGEEILRASKAAYILIFLVVGCLLPISNTSSQEMPATSMPDHIAVINVDPSAPSRPIPAGFLGFSHEWGQAQLLMGNPTVGTNTIYRQLLNNLLAFGGKHFVIRVGGTSTDLNRAATQEVVLPFASLYNDFSKSEPQISFILGVNLGANDPSLAGQSAKAYLNGMAPGSVSAIELGHQPEAYARLKYRPAAFSITGYAADLKKFTAEIRKAAPAVPRFMGPSNALAAGGPAATNFGTRAEYQNLIQSPGLGVISQHAYAAAAASCGGSAEPGSLLQAKSSTEGAKLVEPFVKLAHAAGKSYRISELNSIMCLGEPGISNGFEAALWASDILFEYARTGVDGVNIHTNNWNVNGWDAECSLPV